MRGWVRPGIYVVAPGLQDKAWSRIAKQLLIRGEKGLCELGLGDKVRVGDHCGFDCLLGLLSWGMGQALRIVLMAHLGNGFWVITWIGNDYSLH